MKKDTCFMLMMDISAFFENYLYTKNDFFFYEGMKLVDSALKICSYHLRVTDTKYNLYIIKKDYQWIDIDWFEQLDHSYYNSDFEKVYIVNTLKSLLFDRIGNTVGRDSVNMEIVTFIKMNVYYSPFGFDCAWQQNFMQHNRDMFFTYFFVRGRYEDINLLKKELYDCWINKHAETRTETQQDIEYIIRVLDEMNRNEFPYAYLSMGVYY